MWLAWVRDQSGYLEEGGSLILDSSISRVHQQVALLLQVDVEASWLDVEVVLGDEEATLGEGVLRAQLLEDVETLAVLQLVEGRRAEVEEKVEFADGLWARVLDVEQESVLTRLVVEVRILELEVVVAEELAGLGGGARVLGADLWPVVARNGGGEFEVLEVVEFEWAGTRSQGFWENISKHLNL